MVNNALPQQLIATLEHVTEQTQYALEKAKKLTPANVAESTEETGHFADVCMYLNDLTTLITSGQGLEDGSKITEKSKEDSVAGAFRTASKHQQELFTTLTAKAQGVDSKGNSERISSKLKEYAQALDEFVDQVASQVPDDADIINSEHKTLDKRVQEAVAAWGGKSS